MMHPEISAMADAEYRGRLQAEAEHARQVADVRRSRRLERAARLRTARRRRLRRLVTRAS